MSGRTVRIVLFLMGTWLYPTSALAQGAEMPWWVGIDFIEIKPLQDERTVRGFSGTVVYPASDRSQSFDVEGGFWLLDRLGFAGRYEPARTSGPAQVSRQALDDLNRLITAAYETAGTLSRTDHAVDVSLVARLWRTGRSDLRIIGGPTVFRVRHEMVSVVALQQIPPAPLAPSHISISHVDVADAAGTGVGWHVGGEVAHFFTRHAGISAGVRVRGSHVMVRDPLLLNGERPLFSDQEVDVELDATRVSIAVGARFRF